MQNCTYTVYTINKFYNNFAQSWKVLNSSVVRAPPRSRWFGFDSFGVSASFELECLLVFKQDDEDNQKKRSKRKKRDWQSLVRNIEVV